jgi:outer membrane protein
MSHQYSTARRALWGAVSFVSVLVPAARGEFPSRDPYATQSLTAPAPNRYWVPRAPLPEISTAGVAQGVLPGFEGALSLAQLTDLALRLNPRTRQLWAQARAEAATFGVERADEMPQISGIYNFARSQTSSATSGALVPAQNRFGPSVSLTYVLFDFGTRANEADAARYRVIAANLTQNRTLQEIVFQVEQAYYRLMGFEALVKTNRDSLKNFETSLDATQRRRESGLATVSDVYRAETAVSQARLVLQRSEGEFRKSLGLLNFSVGVPVSYELNLQPVSDLPPVRDVGQSIETLLKQAKATRPDLVAAEARVQSARATAKAASTAGLPSIDVTATAGQVNFTDDRRSVDTFNVGLNLRIPIFTGFRDTYNVRRAEALADQAESVRDQLYSQTELDVWQAYYDLQTAAAGIGSTESQVKSAQQTAQATLARYRAGFGSILDLITAQQDESNARVQRIQSYLDWFTALARLNLSIGVDNILTAASDRK